MCGSRVQAWPTTTSETRAILALSNHGSRALVGAGVGSAGDGHRSPTRARGPDTSGPRSDRLTPRRGRRGGTPRRRSAEQQGGVARDLAGRRRWSTVSTRTPRLRGRRLQPAALLAHQRAPRSRRRGPAASAAARPAPSANGSSKTSRGRGGLDDGQQVLGVAGERGAAAGAADRLRDPARGPRREHGPAPDQRVGVGQRDGQHLGRVDREVAVRRAGDGDVVEGLRRPASASVAGPSCDPVEVGQHHDRGGELVAR